MTEDKPFGEQKSGKFGKMKFGVLNSHSEKQHDDKWVEIQKISFDDKNAQNLHGSIRFVYITKTGDKWKRRMIAPVMTKEVFSKLFEYAKDW